MNWSEQQVKDIYDQYKEKIKNLRQDPPLAVGFGCGAVHPQCITTYGDYLDDDIKQKVRELLPAGTPLEFGPFPRASFH